MKKICKTCGHEVEQGMNFCPNCGQKYPNDDSREIHQAMDEIFGNQNEESEQSNDSKSKTGLIVVLVLLVLLLIGALGALGFNLLGGNNSNDPGIVEEGGNTPDDPSQNDGENGSDLVVDDPIVDEKNPVEDNQDEESEVDEEVNNSGYIEGLDVKEIEFVKDNSDDIYRVIVYFEYTGEEENLNVVLLDPSNTLQVGPIDLPKGADNVYFLLGKTTLQMVNQMDFIFATDQNEITYTVYRADYEQYLQE